MCVCVCVCVFIEVVSLNFEDCIAIVFSWIEEETVTAEGKSTEMLHPNDRKITNIMLNLCCTSAFGLMHGSVVAFAGFFSNFFLFLKW